MTTVTDFVSDCEIVIVQLPCKLTTRQIRFYPLDLCQKKPLFKDTSCIIHLLHINTVGYYSEHTTWMDHYIHHWINCMFSLLWQPVISLLLSLSFHFKSTTLIPLVSTFPPESFSWFRFVIFNTWIYYYWLQTILFPPSFQE